MEIFDTQNVNYDSKDKNDLQKYKTILEMNNANLEGYKAGVTFRLVAELN